MRTASLSLGIPLLAALLLLLQVTGLGEGVKRCQAISMLIAWQRCLVRVP